MEIYTFDKLVGNKVNFSIMQNSLANNTFPNVAVFEGVHGIGKSLSAEITARTLVCDNPIGGNPCLKCPSCLNSMKSLKTTGESMRIKKINIGKLDKKSDVVEMIKEIFIYINSTENSVFILEEAHKLNDDGQSALLEEIDRIPNNVYVILTTTRVSSILDELRSRAITFTFNRLSKKDSEILLNIVCADNGIKTVNPYMKEMIIKHTRGIPRDITLLTNFIGSNAKNEDEIYEFLNIVSNGSILLLFEYLESDDILAAVEYLKELISRTSIDKLVPQLKTFIFELYCFIEGHISEDFNKFERDRINHIFTTSNITLIYPIIEKLNTHSTEDDLKFALVRIKNAIKGKPISQVVKENNRNALMQSTNANNTASYKDSSTVKVNSGSQKITANMLSFLDEDKK